MNNEKGQIKLASFVKRPNTDDVISISKGIANGSIKVYTPVENEEGIIVGSKRVYLKEDLDRKKMDIYDQLKILKDELFQAQKNISFSNIIKIRIKINFLKRELNELEGYKTYIMYTADPNEDVMNDSLYIEDLLQLSRDISSYKK